MGVIDLQEPRHAEADGQQDLHDPQGDVQALAARNGAAGETAAGVMAFSTVAVTKGSVVTIVPNT